ncbi:ribose-phosphate pyrophosphokinase [Steroidobacter denitrificans]|uniref:ribose-phosphate diphosphokinase n=1 Tax=Steroidobacter denitrificans TaxID=465721 RepID=A0A127FDD9_STEDE|nr:ribose-phosphate diphosphokinase [Steroidobacter denitrificans]AMN48404.1 ribose-phosphate pyrophosphokinase [Steroidobacter denitrificans]
MKIFALNTSREFGAAIAATVGIELTAHEEREFEDGEFKVRTLESVRNERVFVCQTLHGDATQSTNDKLCRLLFFIGALKDAAAADVTVVVPYLAYARKDRRTKPRDPVTTRYLAALFEAVGLDAIVTMDVHNIAAFENAFRCRKEHLEAAPLIVRHFHHRIEIGRRIVVLAPDAGGVKRAKAFAELFADSAGRAVELAFMEKQRSEGHVTGSAFAGDVCAAAVIIVDDLASTGTTLARAARMCRERGAAEVYAAVTHGIFGFGAAEALGSTDIDGIVTTDTIGDVCRRCPALAPKLAVLETAPLFAEAVRRMAHLSCSHDNLVPTKLPTHG